MRDYLGLFFGLVGIAIAGSPLIWPAAGSLLEQNIAWVGWMVALLIFAIFVIGDIRHRIVIGREKRDHEAELKKTKQALGNRTSQFRALRKKFAEQENELQQTKQNLDGVVAMSQYVLKSTGEPERPTPRDTE